LHYPAPKYSSVDNTFKVKLGMTQQAVTDTLGVESYHINELNASEEKTLAYKYRVDELKKAPLLMKENKGLETSGNYKDQLVTYNPEAVMLGVKTCYDCDDVKVQLGGYYNRYYSYSAIYLCLLAITVVQDFKYFCNDVFSQISPYLQNHSTSVNVYNGH
jgi:hypothetical protein